jgi:hypothetical protein
MKDNNKQFALEIQNIFDQNDATTQFKIEDEIKRIATSDPRLILNTVKSYVQDNGILLVLRNQIIIGV